MRSAALCSLLVLALAAAGCSAKGFDWFKDAPRKLDDFLVRETPSAELEANVRAARALLASLEREPKPDEALLELTGKLVKLGQVADREHCSRDSIEALHELSQALRKHSARHPFYKPVIERRLNSLVVAEASRRLDICGPFLERESIWAQLNYLDELAAEYANLAVLSDELSGHLQPGEEASAAGALIARANSELNANEGSQAAATRAIATIVQRDTGRKNLKHVHPKTGKLYLTDRSIEADLERYLWQPCRRLLADKRAVLLEQFFKVVHAADLTPGEQYANSRLLRWTANLSSCKRVLRTDLAKLARHVGDKLARL